MKATIPNNGPWRTRIAPSPTGDMHIGTARTAYFNWLAAKASGGTCLLRIDDTDVNRNREECVQVIHDVLDWLEIPPDLLAYQSERKAIHVSRAHFLVDRGLAIRTEDGAVLLGDLPGNLPTSWTDLIAGEVPITDRDLETVRGMVLVKSDGNPTYNWASVIDDIDLGINLVMRGNDHVGNTSKQVILWHLLGKGLPTFVHLGLLMRDGKKISKRDDDSSMLQYMEDDVDPDAMLNYMLRMGWGPSVDDKTTRTIDRNRALELFLDNGKVRNTPANINPDMLAALDRKYKARKRNAERAQ